MEILSLLKDVGVMCYDEKGNIGNKSKDDISQYKVARRGDLVLNSMNVIIGSVGVTPFDGLISPAYYALIPREKVEAKYYELLMRLPAVQQVLKGYAKGIMEIRLRISTIDLLGMKFPVPPPDEQKAIVAYLDAKTAKIDRLIKLKEREIELLQEKKQAVISRVVTRGLDPNVKLVDSGVDWIGKVPDGWRLYRLKYIARSNLKSLGETTDPERRIRYLDIGSVGTGYVKIEPETYLFSGAPSRARRIVEEGDTIVSTVRTYLKSVLYITKEYADCIVSTGFSVLSPLVDKVDARFLGCMLVSDYFVNSVVLESNGVSYPAINDSRLLALPIVLPPIEEQRKIVTYLDAETAKTDKAIAAVTRQIALLKEYRTRLISDAVTGRIDLREAVA